MTAAMHTPIARHRSALGLLVATAALALVPVRADAQLLNPPQRAAEVYAPRSDQARTRMLTFSLTGLGGYDDNVSEGGVGGGGGQVPLTSRPGYIGVFDAVSTYRRTRGTKSFGLNGAAGLTTYRDVGIGPSQRASGGLSAGTDLGRSATVSFNQTFSYDSTYGLETLAGLDNAISPGENVSPGELPTSSSVEGILRRKSWSSDTAGSLQWQMSRRDTTSVGYAFTRRAYIQADTDPTYNQTANASYTRQVSRASSVTSGYTYTQGEFVGGVALETVRPRGTHTVTGGMSVTKRVSPRRTLFVAFGAGGTYVDSTTGGDAIGSEPVPYAYWSPSGYVNARLDVSRFWTLAGNFNRSASTLDGLTAETYVADMFSLSLGGMVGRRVQLAFSGGLASGRQGSDVLNSSDYTTTTGAAQFRFVVTRSLSALAQYTYYHYAFSDNAVLPIGFPSQFDRNSFRVGFTFSIPPLSTTGMMAMPSGQE